MRRLAFYLLPPLLLLALLWGGFWWWSADRLEAELRAWQRVQAEQGREVSFGGVAVGGFPTHLRLQLGAPRVSDASGWLWTGPEVVGRASLWQPQRIELGFPGTQRLEPPPGSTLAPLELAAARAEALVLVTSEGDVEAGRLRFERVALAGYVDGGTSAESVELAWGVEPIAGSAAAGEPAGGALPFLFRVDGLAMPSAIQPPLGRSLERLLAAGRVEGRPPVGPPAESLPLWAAAGGLLDLQSLELVWGPLRLEGAGSLTLDSEHRPLGAGNARILGFERAIEAFTDGGLVEEQIGRMVGLALLALSSEDESGRRAIEVPLTAQDGVLFVGPLPLLPLDPLF